MFCFSGEYSHPYIDREIHTPGMKSQVQALIDAEKRATARDPDPPREPLSVPPAHDQPILSPEATYELLAHQELALRNLLGQGQSGARKGVRELERLLDASNRQKAMIVEEIDEIARVRQGEQEAAAQRMEGLRSVATDLRARIQKVQEAIAELNKQ
jgi:hypothetical protein